MLGLERGLHWLHEKFFIQMKPATILLTTLSLGIVAAHAKVAIAPRAHIKIETGYSQDEETFDLKPVLRPAVNDAAAKATFKVIGGKADPNSANISVLNDGKIPKNSDDPSANFFFAQGTEMGRISVDLGKTISVGSIATYSWHSGNRAPQKYGIYGSKGIGEDFVAEPAPEADPTKAGWVLIAAVDTSSNAGGQHGVSVGGVRGVLGDFRHLLFDVYPTNDSGSNSNTFWSEIDVVEAKAPGLVRYEPPAQPTSPKPGTYVCKDGKYSIVLDSSASPDLMPWFGDKIIPIMLEWYPKVAELISIPGKTPAAPKTFYIQLKEGDIIEGRSGIPGYASGDRIVVSSDFMRSEKDGEAAGCLIHEMVHIVQFGKKGAAQGVPVWFFEGATDYIRWFLFEPEKNGAVIRDPDAVKYDDSYRTTANFIDFVIRKYDKDLLAKIHIAIHDKYDKDLWEKWTGKPVEELEQEWKKAARRGNR